MVDIRLGQGIKAGDLSSVQKLQDYEVTVDKGNPAYPQLVISKKEVRGRIFSHFRSPVTKRMKEAHVLMMTLLKDPPKEGEAQALLRACQKIHLREAVHYSESFSSKFKQLFNISDPITNYAQAYLAFQKKTDLRKTADGVKDEVAQPITAISTELISPESEEDFAAAADLAEHCRAHHVNVQEYFDFLADFGGRKDGKYIEKAAGVNLLTASKNKKRKGWNSLEVAIIERRYDLARLLIAQGVKIANSPRLLGLLLKNDNVTGKKIVYEYLLNNHSDLENFSNKLQILKDMDKCGFDGLTVAHASIRYRSLAQCWGLRGYVQITDKFDKSHRIPLEGMSRHLASNLVSKSCQKFLDSSSTIDGAHKKQIKEAFEQAIIGDGPGGLARIKENNPTIIYGGSETHAIAILLFNDKLIVANRGQGRNQEAACVSYELQASEVSASLLKKLTKFYSTIDDFNRMIDEEFGSKKIMGEGHQQKNQAAGTCTIASSKSIFGALCRELLGRNEGEKVHKDFTAFLRNESLREFLDASTPKTAVEDHQVLQQIYGKIVGTSEGRIKRASKLRKSIDRMVEILTQQPKDIEA